VDCKVWLGASFAMRDTAISLVSLEFLSQIAFLPDWFERFGILIALYAILQSEPVFIFNVIQAARCRR
jgi:hypothetical protein